jgi:hypothetical protein
MDPTASVDEAMVQADILHGEVGAAGTPTHQLGDALHWLAWLACRKSLVEAAGALLAREKQG